MGTSASASREQFLLMQLCGVVFSVDHPDPGGAGGTGRRRTLIGVTVSIAYSVRGLLSRQVVPAAAAHGLAAPSGYSGSESFRGHLQRVRVSSKMTPDPIFNLAINGLLGRESVMKRRRHCDHDGVAVIDTPDCNTRPGSFAVDRERMVAIPRPLADDVHDRR